MVPKPTPKDLHAPISVRVRLPGAPWIVTHRVNVNPVTRKPVRKD